MDTAPKERPLPTAGTYAAIPFAIASVLAVRGAVLSKLWAWFVVPLDAPPIGWFAAMGLSLVVHVVTYRLAPVGDEPMTGANVLKGAATTCVLLAVALAVGALVAVLR